MKKYNTRKKHSLYRRTIKRRPSISTKKGGNSGGDQTLYLVSSESLSRPGYPITRLITTEGDSEGGFMGLERYLSDLTSDIENQLLSIVRNKDNKRAPKRAIVKKYVIKKPVYLPSKF